MPPKITDSRPNPDAGHIVEEQTASGARSVVATYAEDLNDGVTLMCMLGIEPAGLVYKQFAEDYAAEHGDDDVAAEGDKPAKKTAKKTAKKATKKTTKRAAKKTAKKTAKKSAKKTTRKAAKKTSTSASSGS